MKKTLVLIGLFCAVNVQADGLFGAALKPNPSVTLFGQKLTWPIPSLCVGAKAGVTPNANVLVKAGKDNPAIEVKLGAISKQDAK